LLNITYHSEDFGVPQEGHFFVTSHGESACDGVGGTLKSQFAIFNSLPDYLIDLVHDKKQFVKEIKDVLIHNPSYTVDEFLLYCRDKQLKIGKRLFHSMH
jgi:hypothetical protein